MIPICRVVVGILGFVAFMILTVLFGLLEFFCMWWLAKFVTEKLFGKQRNFPRGWPITVLSFRIANQCCDWVGH